MLRHAQRFVFMLALGIFLAGSAYAADAAGSASIGGPFALVDQDGQRVTDKSYDKFYTLVFFGYTSCPDECPTTLHTLAAALRKLGPDAAKLRVLFITTDPARDSPIVMKQYLATFSQPGMIGLSGPPAQIQDVEKEYKVYAQISENPAADNYSVDHSTVVYFMDPAGKSLALFGIDDSADAIAAKIKPLLGKGT